MAELLLELFSEEIPARMQARAAGELGQLVRADLAALNPRGVRSFHAPRRIAVAAELDALMPASETVERGPRRGAPEAALAGFLRKHSAAREELVEEGDYWVLRRTRSARAAGELIAAAVPGILRRFPWPKSMRWDASAFPWVRPLRRILCLLDGAVVPFDLREGEDDGHGLAAGDRTEGHRFMAPGAFHVVGTADWQAKLRVRYVLADADERREAIRAGLADLAAAHGLTILEDGALLDEVTGLVEWPVPLLGRIDAAFMDLPPEVMQVSMRVNQRYFATRHADGTPAPAFAFIANIAAADGGAAIVAGNERVLRARFSDARHFWDLDRKTRLADRVDGLEAITFHARLGSQGARVRRLERLSAVIAETIGADPLLAAEAARLAKADLTTGMVGEFPELQGVMGRYYALHDGAPAAVADAIRDHYLPKGPTDTVPTAPVSLAVALADKLDLLAGFFLIDEIPTGSGDPYALRRAALGVIRIIFTNRLSLGLRDLIDRAFAGFETSQTGDAPIVIAGRLERFLRDRLSVWLREEKGFRHDIVAASLTQPAAGLTQTEMPWDDNFLRASHRVEALTQLIETADGRDLLTAYRRAANILRIEDRKDGPHLGNPDEALFRTDEETMLFQKLLDVERAFDQFTGNESKFSRHMNNLIGSLATLRAPVDAFFEKVTVNDPDPALRRNRLKLLSRIRDTMNRFADFSMIEG